MKGKYSVAKYNEHEAKGRLFCTSIIQTLVAVLQQMYYFYLFLLYDQFFIFSE